MSKCWWKPMAIAQRHVKSTATSAVGTSEHLREVDVQQDCAFKLPFARAKIGPFFQEQPQLGNQFTEDTTLQNYLKRHLPPEVGLTE